MTPTGARYAAIGSSMRRRPVVYAVVAGLVLAALSVAAFGFKATFDLGSAGIPANAESQTALKTLEKGLPPGATDPTVVLLHARSGQPLNTADLSAYQAKLKGLPDVGAVSAPQLGAGRATAAFTVTLTLDPTSTTAVHAVEGPIRTGAHAAAPAGTYALVGGTTAVFADIQKAVNHDYGLVFPVAAAIILVMLGLMLRSLVAPWYLMASVGLGFGAALGATVLFFQDVARLREETAEGRSPREAAALALRHAGPTVGAAGLILAGTFASLALAGNSILAQLGFAVSSGIVLAAVVVATFFTPSVTALAGRAAWWPGDAGPPARKNLAGKDLAGEKPVPPASPQTPGVPAGRHRRD